MPKITVLLIFISALFLTATSALAHDDKQASSEKPSVIDLQILKTDNGVPIYFSPAKTLPMVDVRIVFNAGSAQDSAQYGIAALTNALLSEGTANGDADEIARQFDSVGALFDSNVNRDQALLSLRSLSQADYLSTAASNLAAIITKPTFPENVFTRVKNQQLQAIQLSQQNPDSITRNQFFAGLYPKDNYGHPVIGTAESVKNITLEDVTAFYQKYYVTNNVKLVIVGDLNQTQAIALATQLVGSLPSGHAAKPVKLSSLEKDSNTVHKEFPSSQTHILIGQRGIDFSDPDFFPLYVGNYVLGGGALVSILFDEVREKRGLSYQVYSNFSYLANQGPFYIGLQTKSASAHDAINVVKQTLVNFIQQGPTKSQLQDAKNNLIGSFPLRLDSNQDIANYLTTIAFYQLPLNYLDTFRNKVRAVTQQQIQQAFQHTLQPDTMLTVTVGQNTDAKAQSD